MRARRTHLLRRGPVWGARPGRSAAHRPAPLRPRGVQASAPAPTAMQPAWRTHARPSPRATSRTDPEDPLRVTDATRALGLVVLRGTAVMVVAPLDGTEEIANPFAAAESE